MAVKGKISYLPKSTIQKKRKEKKSVKSTVIDTHIYQDSVDDIESVRNRLYNNNKKHEMVEQLTEDLFHCLYKTYPEVHNIEDVVEENRLSHEILSDLIKSDNFNKLRENTVANLFNSTLSISSVQDQAVKVINDHMKRNKDMKDIMDNISKAKSARKKMEQQQQEGQDSQLTQQKLNELLDKIQKGKDNLTFDIQDMTNDLLNGLGDTVQMVDDINNLLNGFGGDDDASVRKLSYEDKVDLAKAIERSNDFKNICDLVGRMNEMINKVGKKPSPFGHTVTDIGLGNNLTKVLSSEKVKLTDEELEMDFLKKYVNKGLLEFKTDGREDGKGPMVICLDESGSMHGYRDTWAKAFCVACVQIAHKQKRDCRIITFSNRLGLEFEFDKKKMETKKLVDFCSYFLDGGTDFDRPMERAFESIKESKYKKADILFVTDGDPHKNVSDEFIKELNKEKESKGLMVQAILIGNGVRETYVKPFSDSIVRIENLDKDGAIINVFNGIQR